MGQTMYIAPAVLDVLCKWGFHILSIRSADKKVKLLFSISNISQKLIRFCAQGDGETDYDHFFSQTRHHTHTVIYIPDIDQWWGELSFDAKLGFAMNWRSAQTESYVCILSTSTLQFADLPEKLRKLFSWPMALKDHICYELDSFTEVR